MHQKEKWAFHKLILFLAFLLNKMIAFSCIFFPFIYSLIHCFMPITGIWININIRPSVRNDGIKLAALISLSLMNHSFIFNIFQLVLVWIPSYCVSPRGSSFCAAWCMSSDISHQNKYYFTSKMQQKQTICFNGNFLLMYHPKKEKWFS